MFERVETVKRQLKIGEKFLVPCISEERDNKLFITPVINHPHNDNENGQKEVHYHADYRFIKYTKEMEGWIGKYSNGKTIERIVVINSHSTHVYCQSRRPQIGVHGTFGYYILPVINEEFVGVTSVELIKNSTLKHKCIHKGKCPHRGYDLSQVVPIDGKITCPLHGLKFNSETGNLIL